MARWGNCDFKQLQRLKENIDNLQKSEMEQFCVAVSKELAARLLALVIPRTPVGRYKAGEYMCAKGSTGRAHVGREVLGKKGGTLRRGWTGGGSRNGAKAYAASLPVAKQGSSYTIEVTNKEPYASYVEYGHRTRNGKGWVSGHYFLTVSEQDLERLAPAIIEKKLEAFLREAFNG